LVGYGFGHDSRGRQGCPTLPQTQGTAGKIGRGDCPAWPPWPGRSRRRALQREGTQGRCAAPCKSGSPKAKGPLARPFRVPAKLPLLELGGLAQRLGAVGLLPREGGRGLGLAVAVDVREFLRLAAEGHV